MKRYIKANVEKPLLEDIKTEWKQLEDNTGITFSIYSDSGETLFEELFDYNDVDSDAIYDSAIQLAMVSLAQKYYISESALATILDSENQFETVI
jgi:hypothetical protein